MDLKLKQNIVMGHHRGAREVNRCLAHHKICADVCKASNQNLFQGFAFFSLYRTVKSVTAITAQVVAITKNAVIAEIVVGQVHTLTQSVA